MRNNTNRLERVRAALADKGVDLAFIRNLSDIAWVTAFDNVFDSESAHAIVCTQDSAHFHTDSRYIQAVQEAADASVWDISQVRKSHTAWCLEHIPSSEAIHVSCEDTLSVAEYIQLQELLDMKNEHARLSVTHDVVRTVRAVKEEEELARMRAAQDITDKAFDHIISFIRPGMTEKHVAFELECTMRKLGAEDLAFASIVATGANGAKPHSMPGESILQDGDLVVLDFGARAQGYCSDMTRTIGIGSLSQKAYDVYAAVREANERVERVLKAGYIAKDAHLLAEETLAQHGFKDLMGHSLGHGVGIDIHELPNLSPTNTKALVSGNVVTVEPGIYISGELGCRLEDFGVVTDDGFEVFTKSPHELIIIT